MFLAAGKTAAWPDYRVQLTVSILLASFFMRSVVFRWVCFHSEAAPVSCHRLDLWFHKLLINVRLYWKTIAHSLNPYLCLMFIE